jgi:predicted ester cyclase
MRYFEAIASHDLDAAAACWAPGAVDRLVPVGDLVVPGAWRDYFLEVLAAMPDFAYELRAVVADGDRVVVQWRANGTFTGMPFQGIRPTGGRVELEGVDLLLVRDGLIQHNDSYWDDTAVGRQLGLLPAKGSRGERTLLALFNLRTRVARTLSRR